MTRTLLAAAISCALACASASALAATAYVSNEKDNTLSVIDLNTLETVETLEVGMRPRGLTLSHDNKLLYICASDSDTVQVMDLATRQIIKQL
ncbi:MAG: beta-propeller fold lactonase family protein, partial [Pseudomonas stutzeri]|nr:beta-propeller fold lactonase family protein [Stutzerimonas stutzeri]